MVHTPHVFMLRPGAALHFIYQNLDSWAFSTLIFTCVEIGRKNILLVSLIERSNWIYLKAFPKQYILGILYRGVGVWWTTTTLFSHRNNHKVNWISIALLLPANSKEDFCLMCATAKPQMVISTTIRLLDIFALTPTHSLPNL